MHVVAAILVIARSLSLEGSSNACSVGYHHGPWNEEHAVKIDCVPPATGVGGLKTLFECKQALDVLIVATVQTKRTSTQKT